ncbi:hypothetical protein E4U56_007229 [Claviceps arundinis]|uniref:Uncharacterized protein n=1 Tax=Claviceps arundinis TaxID=1623583 RepID=A0A9P7MV11_9HYPO|nr:hypothetical protein E4U56_007229 [Claviceps arundinis]
MTFEPAPSVQEVQNAEEKKRSSRPEMSPAAQARKRRKSSSPIAPIAPGLVVCNPSKRQKTIQSLPSVPARCSSRSRPSLQTLPVELLEIIFLCSMDLALPRASPLLGAKLSAKSTRLRAFMMGFHDTWDRYFGIPRHEIYKSIRNDEPALKGEEELQAALLSMPWVDIDFILEAQQTWANVYAAGRCYQHHVGDCCQLFPSWEKVSHIGHPYQQHALQHEEGALKFNARACFEAEYERALQYPPMPFHFLPCVLRGSLEVNINVPLPVELITGPWDEEKKRRLYWLSRGGQCHGGTSYSWFEYPWEVRLACLNAAVIYAEKLDPLILNCLIGGWLFEDVPKDAKREPLVKLCNRIARAGETPEMMDTLRYIVRLMDTDWNFIQYHEPEEEWNASLI